MPDNSLPSQPTPRERAIQLAIDPSWVYQPELPFPEPPPEPQPKVMPEEEFRAAFDRAKLINRDNLQSREPQRRAVVEILSAPSREVLGFGWPSSGKTAIAAEVIAHILTDPSKRALFLTQQRALCTQAESELRRFLNLAPEQIELLTPKARSARRRGGTPLRSRLDIATAHSALSDLRERTRRSGETVTPLLRLEDYAVVIIDEVHLARGRQASAEIIRLLRALPESSRPFLLTLSGTPWEPGRRDTAGVEEHNLRELLGPQAVIVPVDIPKLEHQVRSRRLEFSPRILELSTELLAIIHSVQDIVHAGVSEWPDLADRVAAFVSPVRGGIAQTGSGKREVELRAAIESTMPRSRERDAVRDATLVLGRLCYLYQQLWSLGTFPFLDTFGRLYAWAHLPRFESTRFDSRTKTERTTLLSPLYLGERDVWFMRLLHQPRMHTIQKRLHTLYLRAALGTPYEAVLTSSNLDSLAWNMSRIDPTEEVKDSSGILRLRYPTERKLFEATFTEARRLLAQKLEWHDHPKTDEILRVVRQWTLEEPFERVILGTSSAQHAFFLADTIAAHCQGLASEVAVPFAGRKHLSEAKQLAFLELFRQGSARTLAATQAFGYGHHIPDARILYVLDPIDSAKARQQYEDRIDRARRGDGFIVYLTMRDTSEERRYFAGRSAQKQMVRDLERVRRREKRWED